MLLLLFSPPALRRKRQVEASILFASGRTGVSVDRGLRGFAAADGADR